MLKFLLQGGAGGGLVLVGLDRRNVDRMVAGNQLFIDRAPQLGIALPIIVQFGERYADVVDDLSREGVNIPTRVLDVAKELDGDPGDPSKLRPTHPELASELERIARVVRALPATFSPGDDAAAGATQDLLALAARIRDPEGGGS